MRTPAGHAGSGGSIVGRGPVAARRQATSPGLATWSRRRSAPAPAHDRRPRPRRRPSCPDTEALSDQLLPSGPLETLRASDRRTSGGLARWRALATADRSRVFPFNERLPARAIGWNAKRTTHVRAGGRCAPPSSAGDAVASRAHSSGNGWGAERQVTPSLGARVRRTRCAVSGRTRCSRTASMFGLQRGQGGGGVDREWGKSGVPEGTPGRRERCRRRGRGAVGDPRS